MNRDRSSELPTPAGRSRVIFFVILALSFGLRVLLIVRGGQNYWPDETRYRASREAAKALWSGQLRDFGHHLQSADHFLFKVIGVLPASLEVALGENARIPALFFALFSVASLGLLGAILRRLGESERVALLATGLLAASTTFLYFSRHLVPYDLAMALGLGALWVGLRQPARLRDSLYCGLLASATFLTYNGYWLLAGFAMIAHTLYRPRSFGNWLKRALLSAVALAAPILTLLAVDRLVGGPIYKQFVAFSGSVIQGSYAEGWSLPLAYLWHAEHLLVALWAAALLAGLLSAAQGDRRAALLLGLGGALFVYGALVVFSVFFEKFVVYGRLARQVVPFCCILAALLLGRWWTASRRGRSLALAVLVLAGLQAASNFKPPFLQPFPEELKQAAGKLMTPAAAGRYELNNVEFLWPVPNPLPAGQILLEQPHPTTYWPYLYEGYDPDQRAKFRAGGGVKMRLLLLPPAAPPPAAPRGPEIFSDGFESGSTAAWSTP